MKKYILLILVVIIIAGISLFGYLNYFFDNIKYSTYQSTSGLFVFDYPELLRADEQIENNIFLWYKDVYNPSPVITVDLWTEDESLPEHFFNEEYLRKRAVGNSEFIDSKKIKIDGKEFFSFRFKSGGAESFEAFALLITPNISEKETTLINIQYNFSDVLGEKSLKRLLKSMKISSL